MPFLSINNQKWETKIKSRIILTLILSLNYLIAAELTAAENTKKIRPEQNLLKAYQAESFDPQTEKEQHLNNKYDRTPASIQENQGKRPNQQNLNPENRRAIEKKLDAPKDNLGLDSI